jgi:hypothetical protein
MQFHSEVTYSAGPLAQTWPIPPTQMLNVLLSTSSLLCCIVIKTCTATVFVEGCCSSEPIRTWGYQAVISPIQVRMSNRMF